MFKLKSLYAHSQEHGEDWTLYIHLEDEETKALVSEQVEFCLREDIETTQRTLCEIANNLKKWKEENL